MSTRSASLPSRDEVVLEGLGLAKRFGAVTAVRHVDIQLRRGVVTALVGDNGAGKSTLVKLLCGVLAPDEGQLRFLGKETTFRSPRDARRLGIEAVWQNLALAGDLDVPSNLFLGRELVYGSRLRLIAPLRFRAMAAEARSRIEELGARVPLEPGATTRNMSGGQQQAVAIAKAAGWASHVLFMDEPTAALGVHQSQRVFESAKQLARKGLAIAIISHSIPQVLATADVVIVLRHGLKVAELPAKDTTPEQIVTLMVMGSDLSTQAPTAISDE